MTCIKPQKPQISRSWRLANVFIVQKQSQTHLTEHKAQKETQITVKLQGHEDRNKTYSNNLKSSSKISLIQKLIALNQNRQPQPVQEFAACNRTLSKNTRKPQLLIALVKAAGR